MTENRITELWNKAVADVGDCTYPQIITRFSEFVVLDEREACAKVCESEAQWWRDSDAEGSESLAYEDKALESAARAIRMRSNVEFSGTPAALSPEAPLERRVGGCDGKVD